MLLGTLTNSIMCRYFCTGFIDFIFKDKSLLAYTDLLSLNEKNIIIIIILIIMITIIIILIIINIIIKLTN